MCKQYDQTSKNNDKEKIHHTPYNDYYFKNNFSSNKKHFKIKVYKIMNLNNNDTI